MVKVSIGVSIPSELLDMLNKLGINKSDWATKHANEDLKWFKDNTYQPKNILINDKK